MKPKVNIKNKKASYLYELTDSFTAGIVIFGSEIKSIRLGRVSFTDAYCQFINNELWIKGLHIAEYFFASHYNHEPKRERKLLLNRRELDKLEGKVNEKGFSIIPTRLYINEKGLAKLDIALARGKRMSDKREDIKKKDSKRDIDRMMKM